MQSEELSGEQPTSVTPVMTHLNCLSDSAAVETQVVELLNAADARGVDRSAVVSVAVQLLCLLALANRPLDVCDDELRDGLLIEVGQTLDALQLHPFAQHGPFH